LLLSTNPSAIHILEKNPEKIKWWKLSTNPNAIHLLEKNQDILHFPETNYLNLSSNPNAIHLLQKYPDKINWYELSLNPAIFELDYQALKDRCAIYKEELIQEALKPSRIFKYLDNGMDLEEILENM